MALLDMGKPHRRKNVTPTTQNETTPTGVKPLEVSRSVFDLDSKDDVTVVKIGSFTPVSTMAEFTARLGNDAAKILSVVNEGLEAYDREVLANNDQPWQVKAEDGTLSNFSGTLLNEEGSKFFAASVLNFAKMVFKYSKDMAGGKEAKRKAKEQAADVLLSNPATIEALKTQYGQK